MFSKRTSIAIQMLSIEDDGLHLLVESEVNGKSCRLLIDTGASRTVFDQNRIGVLLGYRLNKNFRFEGGYLNQTVQYGRQIDGKNVFQSNNGFIINTNFNL